MNRTPWFPGDVSPARPGVYERQTVVRGFGVYTYGDPFYAAWDGHEWGAMARTPVDAARAVQHRAIRAMSPLQPHGPDAGIHTRWRGLLNEFLPA